MSQIARERELAILELATRGVIARYMPAIDESVDDAIDVWVLRGGQEVEVGSIQLAFDRTFVPSIWLDAETVLDGVAQEDLGAAMTDLLGMLIGHGHEEVLTPTQIDLPDFDDIATIRRLVGGGWRDVTSKSDPCPVLRKGLAVLWVDWIDESRSAWADVAAAADGIRRRFAIQKIHPDGLPGQPGDDAVDCLTVEDALDEALTFEASPNPAPRFRDLPP